MHAIRQWVGETGWQLSHGERDRIYMARALLQRAKLLILDESLAALDLTRWAMCSRPCWRVRTLLLIAHP
jgi:ATP-binding cassette subfamily B protein